MPIVLSGALSMEDCLLFYHNYSKYLRINVKRNGYTFGEVILSKLFLSPSEKGA